MAAWIKSALAIFSGATHALQLAEVTRGSWLLAAAVPDMWLGIGSVAMVSWLAGARNDLAQIDSFGWTLLTVLLQGGLVAVLVLLLSGVVLSWRQLRAWLWRGGV